MATQGQAAKSASGASMSKYDVEVEERLQKLEAIAHEKCAGGGSVDEERIVAIEKRIDEIAEKIMYKLGI